MKSSYSNPSKRASVDSMMTPMIDVVFLLLVFFLATSSFQRLEKTLPSAVASSASAAQSGNSAQQEPQQNFTDLSDIVVRIVKSKDALAPNSVQYSLNKESIPTLELLTNRIRRILQVRPDIPLVIDPEDDVSAGEAIRVYDLARANGSVAVFLVAR